MMVPGPSYAAAAPPVARYDAPPGAMPMTTGRLQYVAPATFVGGGSGSYAPPAAASMSSSFVAPGQLGISRSTSYVPPAPLVGALPAVSSRPASYVPPVTARSSHALAGLSSALPVAAPAPTPYGPPTAVAPGRISYVPPA